MKRIYQADIDEMISRGFCKDTVEQAKCDFELTILADEVIGIIERAFHGVTLKSGVGLYQGRGLDDYMTDEECAKLRSSDEKNDWRNISSDDLNTYFSSLSFFDAEGLRFHLPAFLCADLRGEYEIGLEFHLVDIGELADKQFSLLNSDQRSAVRKYLEVISCSNEYTFSRENIIRAINGYWSDHNDAQPVI